MAKKIISKSKRDGDSSLSTCYRQNGGIKDSGNQKARQNGFPARTFNGSENDLSLNYNSVPRLYSGQFSDGGYNDGRGGYNDGRSGGYTEGRGGIRYAPNGRTSPEVQMYKTRVIYHSRQDCSDHHSSV